MATCWTEEDICTLQRAIADGKGVRSLTFADQTVTFNGIDDMLRLLAVMRQSLSTSKRYRLAAVSKGV